MIQVTAAAIVRVVRSWLGTPWHHQASLKGKGTDCIGLIAGVARELGLREAAEWANDERRKSYGKQPDPAMLLAAADQYLDRQRGASFARGDILLMRFAADPQHFALVSEVDPVPYMVHAYASARQCVENRIDDVWRSRIVAVYRYKGTA